MDEEHFDGFVDVRNLPATSWTTGLETETHQNSSVRFLKRS